MSKTRKYKYPLKISKKRKGAFTRKAQKARKTVQDYANYVIKKLKGTQKLTKKNLRLLRQAVFAKNAKKWKRHTGPRRRRRRHRKRR